MLKSIIISLVFVLHIKALCLQQALLKAELRVRKANDSKHTRLFKPDDNEDKQWFI